jgi:hypothetical protein
MAIVGDITIEEAKAQVEKHFAKWQKKEVPRATYPTPKPTKGAAVAIVNKSGAVQSVIDVTYPIDMKQGHPDEIKLKVANGILGGGSTGRLFQNLRETHAWTYGSYSSFRTDELTNAGSFSATSNSTTSASDSSVAEILKEMEKLRTVAVSNEELEGFKSYMAGTFALGLEDPKTLARYAINEKKYNMPAGYYKNYLKNVEAVTAQDVMTVANKYITPGVANITVAGDKKQIAEKFKKFGPVTIYDMYGNVEKEEAPVALPANMSAAQIISKFIAVTGGEDAWKKVVIFSKLKIKVMLVKDLKKVLEGLDDEKSIKINICDYERVESSSEVILELIDYSKIGLGYILELDKWKEEEEEGERDEDDIEDFDDIS